MATTGGMRATALRAGGACVRCRKGKTKCVYENGRAPCRNCAKGMHECYLPSESNAHIHGQTPARHAQASRPARDSLPGAGSVGDSRASIPGGVPVRGISTPEKYVLPPTHLGPLEFSAHGRARAALSAVIAASLRCDFRLVLIALPMNRPHHLATAALRRTLD